MEEALRGLVKNLEEFHKVIQNFMKLFEQQDKVNEAATEWVKEANTRLEALEAVVGSDWTTVRANVDQS